MIETENESLTLVVAIVRAVPDLAVAAIRSAGIPAKALVLTEDGMVLQFDIQSDGKLLDKVHLSNKKIKMLSHPAITSDRLLIRMGTELCCYRI